MLHPIFSTVLGHPELVADHLANYAALVRQETAQAGRGIVARIVAGVLAAASAMMALGLIGVAVLAAVLKTSDVADLVTTLMQKTTSPPRKDPP
jgi:purine-cytosine permease-like protein